MIEQFYFWVYTSERTENRSQRKMCRTMFIETIFRIVKTWRQSKCLSTDEQISKLWYKHTVECYLALKKKEILIYATA